MIVYGTNLCPDYIELEETFQREGIEYEYINITESIANLKAFLAYRDTRPEFELIKANGSVGVPCIIFEDGEIIFDMQEAVNKYNK